MPSSTQLVDISDSGMANDMLPDAHSLASLDLGFVTELENILAVQPLQDIPALAPIPSSSSGPSTRRRTRASKAVTPLVTSQVRRSPRFSNDGYMHAAIPDRAPRRRSSSVPRASPPAIMQISEMQRIGIEDCNIDPAELSEEQLRQERHG